MKALNFLLILIAVVVQAQNPPIVPLGSRYWEVPSNSYFKDINNELNKYVGTWHFSNSTQQFTLVIQKKQMIQIGDSYYDYLVGEYRYVENGVELINTVPLLSSAPNDIENRNVGGNKLITKDMILFCPDCVMNEKRALLYFSDPQRPYLTATQIVLHIKMELTEPQQMTATIFQTDSIMIPDDNVPLQTSVPYGTYLMVKHD